MIYPSSSSHNNTFIITFLEKFGDYGQYGIPAMVGGYALMTGAAPAALVMGGMGYLQGKLVFIIKRAFPRERPEPFILGRVSREDRESFPSSHTGGAFLGVGFALGMYGSTSIITISALVLAIIVALSRYVSKKHWATDILAGACIGMAFGFLAGSLPLWCGF